MVRVDGDAPPRWYGYIAAAAMLLAAWWLYRPEVNRPFDFLDFGEFLPYLKRTSNPIEQAVSIAQYNAEQSGRANLTPVAGVVMKWQLFGMWSPGWQLTHAALLVIIMGQTWALLRAFGASAGGALAAVSVYLVAPGAATGWIRLTMGEPLAMVVILAVTLRATRFQQVVRWGREVVGVCAACVFALLTKEMLAPVVLLPVVVAVAWRGGHGLQWPEWTRRNVVMVASVALTGVATLLPLTLLYLNAADGALASQYGRTAVDGGRVLAIWLGTLAPFSLPSDAGSVMWGLCMVSYAWLMLTGGVAWIRQGPARGSARALLVLSLLFPLVGAAAYSPWPAYEDRYGFPYLVGTTVLVGMTLTALMRANRTLRLAGICAWSACLVFGATAAAASARRADARQRAIDDVVQHVAAWNVDTVYVAASRMIEPAWVRLGPTLQRYGTATERRWAATSDVLCDDAAERTTKPGRVAVVAFLSQCQGGVPATTLITHRFARVDWSQWRLVQDSVSAAIWRGKAS